MILHGIEAPNIRHMNTLADNINDIQEKDRCDIISRLYNDNLRQIEITFPKSLSKQKAIIKKLDALSVETKNWKQFINKN